MSIITTSCSCCSREIAFPEEVALKRCPACGTLNARPRSEGNALESLRRAIRQRSACDFRNAENSYQHVLLDCPEEHEALWGLALCRYGVEYVDDPKTGRRVPVVHGVRRRPLQLDGDFQQACECAPADIRAQYERDAAYIDEAMTRIRQLARSCPPYDVFLCYKHSMPGSAGLTQDYARAFQLYHNLDKLGYRVFFAPEAMEHIAAGSDYEAAIYHALDTAKVMLVICSEPEYLSTPWVSSEMRRFLEMVEEREQKHLIPLLYGGMPASKLPRELRLHKIEAITMESFNAQETLLTILRRYCGKEQGEPPRQTEPVRQGEPPRQSEPYRQTEPVRQTEPYRPSEPPRQTEPVRQAEPYRPSEPLRQSEPPRQSEPIRVQPRQIEVRQSPQSSPRRSPWIWILVFVLVLLAAAVMGLKMMGTQSLDDEFLLLNADVLLNADELSTPRVAQTWGDEEDPDYAAQMEWLDHLIFETEVTNTPKPTRTATSRPTYTPTPRPTRTFDVTPYLPYVPPGGITANCGYPESIMWVQQCLRRLDYGLLSVDGKWGNQTSTAVRQFKQDYGYSTSNLTVTYDMVVKMAQLFGKKENWDFSILRHYIPK